MAYRFAFGRPPAVAAHAMAATSQPLATRAALRMLEQGGNAADAAIAAAAVTSVTEPMSTGLGGAGRAGGRRRAAVGHRPRGRRRLAGARRALRPARPRHVPGAGDRCR